MNKRLKIRRIEVNKKQKEVAKDVGISQQYLSNLENGVTKNPSLDIMKKLSKSLNTTVQYLFFE